MIIRLVATSFVAAALLACSDAAEPEDFLLPPGSPAPIALDASVYNLTRVEGGYTAQAVATYTNETGRIVYFPRCTPDSHAPMYEIRRTGADSTARSVYFAAWACVGGVPTGRLDPGESLTAQVSLGSPDSPNAQPPIAPESRVGYFRIEFALCSRPAADSDGDCGALPQAARESGAFEIRLGEPQAGAN